MLEKKASTKPSVSIQWYLLEHLHLKFEVSSLFNAVSWHQTAHGVIVPE
jgi:hypothetical protein